MVIDTHVLIWLSEEPDKVAPSLLRRLENPEEQLFVSQFAFIEVAIKKRVGKLRVSLDDLRSEAQRTNIKVVPITDKHLDIFAGLTNIGHKDPFDIAQMAVAIAANRPLVTADATVLKLRIEGLELIDARK